MDTREGLTATGLIVTILTLVRNIVMQEELEGDELKANLLELRTELADLGAPTKYDQIIESKLEKEWRKVEQNRALGYNGNSK